MRRIGQALMFLWIGAAARDADAQATVFETTSGANLDAYGIAVSGGGDVNGDGVPDFIVGMPGADHPDGTKNVGGFEVRSGVDASILHLVYGDQANCGFGAAVAHVGDVDFDGFGDYVVAAPDYVPGQFLFNAGAIYLFSGQTGNVIFRVDALVAKERLGYSVAGVGDVDGDAIPDFAAGMFCNSCSTNKGGAVRVFSGKDGTLLRIDFFPVVGQLGRDVGAAGDANADGTPDVVSGAPLGSASVQVAGDAYVYSGADFSIVSMSSGDHVLDDHGYAVGPAGDVDGDGFDDVVVGDVGDSNDGGATRPGSVTVVRGQNGQAIQKQWGPHHFSLYGGAVDGGFDVDADGTPDYVVGAYLFDAGVLADAGAAFVYSGADASELYSVDGGGVQNGFGKDVRGAGDVDGDGRAEIVVGTAHPNTGFARVVRLACGSVTSYGAGCAGSNGSTPLLGLGGCAAAGETVSLSISGGLPSGAAFLFVGAAEASIPAGGGCSLLVAPAVGPFGPLPLDAGGSLVAPVVLPPPSAGAVVTAQAFLSDPALAQGFSTTRGLKIAVD